MSTTSSDLVVDPLIQIEPRPPELGDTAPIPPPQAFTKVGVCFIILLLLVVLFILLCILC